MQNLVAYFGNMFQMGAFTVLHLLYAFKTMLSSCHCGSYLSLLCITDHKYLDVKYHLHNVGIQDVIYLIHTFCVYVLLLCVLLVLF